MIYILLPAYNEEDSIPNLFTKLEHYLGEEGLEASIVLLDDGSLDTTSGTARRYQGGLDLVILSHGVHHGLPETVRDLFEYAAARASGTDILIRMDCDHAHDLSVIGKMNDLILKGQADVVTASKAAKGGGMQGSGRLRAFTGRLSNFLLSLVFPLPGLRDYSSSFRAYRASLIKDALRLYGGYFVEVAGLGHTSALEKALKLRLMGARFAETGHWFHHDPRRSAAKVLTSVTAFGCLVLAVLYYWPFGGWRSRYGRAGRSLREDHAALEERAAARKRLRKIEDRL